jgi:hypothetical protein
MEKRNVVEDRRTPDHEISRPDEDWDKQAADAFMPLPDGVVDVSGDGKDLGQLTVRRPGR